MTLEAFIFFVVLLAVLCRLWVWFRDTNLPPEPWGPEVEKALQSSESVPVCPHCLAPQVHEVWFCPDCGSTVGPYNNYSPYLYIFSLGEALRAALSGTQHHRPLVRVGAFLVLLSFAPVVLPVAFYYRFIKKTNQPAPDAPAAGSAS
jgi:hypothetical protein